MSPGEERSVRLLRLKVRIASGLGDLEKLVGEAGEHLARFGALGPEGGEFGLRFLCASCAPVRPKTNGWACKCMYARMAGSRMNTAFWRSRRLPGSDL